MNNRLTLEQQDALKEIATVGAGNAASALSQLVKKRVGISIPSVKLVPLNEASLVFGSAEEKVHSVYMQLLGDVTGIILISFKQEIATKLADLLLGTAFKQKNMEDAMVKSALKESATIIAGAYLNALSKFLKMNFVMSNPGLAVDMAGALIGNVLAEVSKDADTALIMETELSIVDELAKAYFFFIPETGYLKKIFDAMGL